MLMTPMMPKTIASPSAISRRIEAREAPWNAVSTAVVRIVQRSIFLMAAAAAARSPAEAEASPARRASGAVVGSLDLDQVLIALGRLGAAHEDLDLATDLARVDVAVAQRAQAGEPLRIAGAAQHGDGRISPVGVRAGQVGQRALDIGGGRGGVAHGRSREPRHEQHEGERSNHAFFW